MEPMAMSQVVEELVKAQAIVGLATARPYSQALPVTQANTRVQLQPVAASQAIQSQVGARSEVEAEVRAAKDFHPPA